MKSETMKFFGTTRSVAMTACIAAFVTLVISVPCALAQEVDQQTPIKTERLLDILERQKKAIVGSWLITVTTPGFPPLKTLLTFTEDGNVMGTGQGDVTASRALSVGQGVWSHQGGRTFASTFLQISYETQTGVLRGLVKFRLTHTLDSSGNEWSGPYKFDFLDPAGNPVFSAGGTTQAQRIKVELLP